MIILIMIETISWGSFNHDQMKRVQNGRWMQEEASGLKTPNWGYYEANFLVEIWGDEEIQRQLLAMGRKHNIWKNIVAKLNNNGYKHTALQCKIKIHNLEQKSKKFRLNLQRMNATATVISSSILQLTFDKFMQV